MKRNKEVTRLLSTFIVMLALVGLQSLLPVAPVAAAGGPTIEIIAGYNLVVDSNVKSPSTYAPRAATVIGEFCNTGTAPLTNVYGYIGNYVDGSSDTPGVYPIRDSLSDAEFQAGQQWNYLYNTGNYFFRHIGGTADAARFIGDIAPGECKYLYWSFEYPACENVGGAWAEPPCTNDPLWGTSVKPEDDFSLKFDIWSTSDQGSEDATWTMTMRNEISAMANKIKPNPDGVWFNTDTSTVRVGEVITTNGVNYELGNIRHGFDNDGDYAPDFNAWMQPISRPSFDPSCFRLIRTTGTLTVSRSAKPNMIIPFTDQLYFTNLPPDNNGVRGVVYYTFLALDGPCNVGLSPYQEVASGFDNEKFNGDYGAGIPPVVSLEPELTLDKSSAPDTIAAGSTTTYTIPFANTGDGELGLTLSSGYGVTMPLMISDTVPLDMEYVCGSATYNLDYPLNNGGTIRYSTDGGQSWSTSEPTSCPGTNPTSLAGNEVILQWWLNDPLPAKTTPNNTSSGYAQFQATVPGTYSGPDFIENEACAGLGDADPFMCESAITMIQGTNSIGDFVWRDEDNDGVQDGDDETGIDGVTVSLYWDQNGDGALDDDDMLISTQVTAGGGAYDFTLLPDGDYLVIVDHLDDDIPAGYRPTTSQTHAVSVSGGQNYDDADFGFGPSFTLSKVITSGDLAYEGDLIIYTITLENTRPGDGTGNASTCVYDVWATSDSSATAYGVPFTSKLWESAPNAFGATEPDGLYAVNDYSQGYDRTLAGTGYNIGDRGGNIVAVEALFRVYVSAGVDPQFTDDDATVGLCYNDIQLGTNTFNETTLNTYLGASNAGWLVWPVTALPPNGTSWEWQDFSGNLDLVIAGAKSAGADDVFLNLDVMGFRITTDRQCGGSDDNISPLPLTDTYDAAKLEFVSADPTQSIAASGAITWNNVGPLYAGQTMVVTTIFRALEPSGNVPISHTNYITSANAKFLDGQDVNDASDSVEHSIYPTGEIGDFVWRDLDSDGVQDGGTETGIANVVVSLTANVTITVGGVDYAPGTVVTTTTDADGAYLFEGLRYSGNYTVTVDTTTLPGGSGSATNTYDEDDGTTSPDSQTIITSFNPAATDGSDTHVTADFGYTIPSVIEGTIWHDWDQSGTGTPDDGEEWLSGVIVCLDDGACDCSSTCDTTTTDENGYFQFVGSYSGTYTPTVQTGTGDMSSGAWTQSFDTDGTGTADTVTVTVITGGSARADYSYYQTGSSTIGDTLYVDWNGDATQDTGEEGIPNVTVTLYEDSDGDGEYDSDTDALIATDVTDANGEYLFTGRPAGDYLVVINTDDPDLPSNYVQTYDADDPVGTVCTDCDSMSSVAGVDGSNNYLAEDFGYQPIGSGSIGDFVWQDDDGDGVQDAGESGIADITVRLYEDQDGDGEYNASVDALIATTTTDTAGAYLFENLPAGDYLVDVAEDDSDLPAGYVLSTDDDSDLNGYDNDMLAVTLSTGEDYLDADFGFTTGGIIGDYVWQDDDGDGNQDESEAGIAGVDVSLYLDVNGNGVYDSGTDTLYGSSTTTDASGYYTFTNLPANDYVVVVDTSTLPTGFTQTGDPDLTAPCVGGQCDSESGLTLDAGQIDRSRDFGYQPPGVLGDLLWVDANGNNAYDDGEPGVPYVTVGLYQSDCTTPISTTETNSDGYYIFGNLSDATYCVVVDTSDPDYTALGITPTYDLDGGNDNQAIAALTSGEHRYDVDFGYQLTGTGAITGHVFFDASGAAENNDTYDDGTDTPYANIPVYLWNNSGQLVGVTTTNASGVYTFTNLPAGDFTVSVDPNSPQLNGLDLAASPNPGYNYNTVTVTAGNTVTDQDFGFYADLDFGDLLDSYNTLLASEGPNHVRSALVLGLLSDAEGDGQPDNDAGVYDGGGDDGSNSDEDGVARNMNTPQWISGDTVPLTITVAGGSGRVVGWFDWDDDGDFDEMVDFGTLAMGNNLVNLPLPLAYSTGTNLNARFRLFDPDALPGGSLDYGDYLGAATGGEVEDYQWHFDPNAVSLTSFTASASRGSLTLLIAFVTLVMIGIVVLSATVLRRRYKH